MELLKFKDLILTVVAAIFLQACIVKEQGSGEWRQTVVDEVTKTLYDYHAAVKDKGLKAEFEFLDSTSDFFWIPPGYGSALTYDSIAVIIRSNAKSLRNIDLKWKTLTVYLLTSHIASYNGIVAGTMTHLDSQTNHISLIESGAMIRRSDKWKMLSGQTAVLTD